MAAIRTGLPGNFSGAAVSRPVGLTELSNIIYDPADPDLATMTKLYFRHIDGIRASERRSQKFLLTALHSSTTLASMPDIAAGAGTSWVSFAPRKRPVSSIKYLTARTRIIQKNVLMSP